jgi:hypothetical protein
MPSRRHMSEPSRRTETFIVRIWVEYLEQTPPIWRGQVEHVGDKEIAYFGDLREMSKWIEHRVEMQRHIREQEGEER